MKHHQHLLQKSGKIVEDIDTGNDYEGPKAAKIRHIDSGSQKETSNNGNTTKQIIKDLRVKVERLSTDSHGELMASQETKGNKSPRSKAGSEERQVPHLPVAEDEPTREISSTCPQGLKKEGSQEDMVTSSSQEPRSKCVLVQTEQIQTEVIPAKVY